ncbi:MAG TPA: hypothetical protein VN837_13255 [Chloroflexota bacterium]|nr:hypothetical protein [Chloroflexota bacterium]
MARALASFRLLPDLKAAIVTPLRAGHDAAAIAQLGDVGRIGR